MASLRPGVLLKLLRNMNNEVSSNDMTDSWTSVLQVIAIIPRSLAGSDVFSSEHGFYLKVSDASHSTSVCLPPALNELVLADLLQLGQFIHVDRLLPGSPHPTLDGLTLLPGRQPCLNRTAEVVASKLPVSSGTSPLHRTATMPPSSPTMEKKKKHQQPMSNLKSGDSRSTSSIISVGGGSSTSKNGRRSAAPSASPVSGPLTKRELDRRRSDASEKASPTYIDDQSYDSDDSKSSFSTSSSPSSYTSRSRRGWGAIKRGLTGSRREMDFSSPAMSPSASSVSSGSFGLREDDIMDAMFASKRNSERAYNSLSSNSKRKLSVSAPCSCSANVGTVPSSSINYDLKKQEKIRVNWESLSPSLVKHGKEMLKQRDLALQTAVEALLEASATERILECLGTYSELQSKKDSDPQQLVDKFLTLQQDIAYTRLITHSVPKLGPPKTCICNLASMASTKSLGEIALERRSCATSWVKEALKSSLQKFPNDGAVASECIEFPATNERPLSSHYPHQPKTVVPKESSILAASNDLQQECNRRFLRFLDKFLHSVQEIQYSERETIVVNLLCQLKRVDDWLNTITSKRSKESMPLEDEEAEACTRVRKKIYSILLRHVETAAIALESMSTKGEEEEQNL